MHYIVGLGNKGAQYENTRHNVGWLVLSAVMKSWVLPPARQVAKYQGAVSEGLVANVPVMVLFPETFMNASGNAVAKLVPLQQAPMLCVVYDDIDIALGEVKVSFGRGSGGHNGVASIITTFGTKDFVRIRIGIAPKSFWSGQAKRPGGDTLPGYVLGAFTKRELQVVAGVAQHVEVILETIIKEGKAVAMNRFN